MDKSNQLPPEVQEHRGAYPSLWAAVVSIAPKTGWVPQTHLRTEIDSGQREGRSTAERERRKALEHAQWGHSSR